MADTWIKVEYSTVEKIEVAKMATAMGMDQYTVVGRLVRIWSYFDLQSRDGRIDGIDATFLDRLVQHPGFCAQMAAVGWMNIDNDGITLPSFDRHNSGGAKARAQAAVRQSNHRKNAKRDKSNASRNAAPLRGALPEEIRGEQKREEQKSPLAPKGGEDQGVLPFSPPEIDSAPLVPTPLDTPAFAAAWAEWLSYRRGRRLSCRQATLTRQLAFLAEHGEKTAIRIIEESIRNGWQGLFEPKKGASYARPAPGDYDPTCEYPSADIC